MEAPAAAAGGAQMAAAPPPPPLAAGSSLIERMGGVDAASGVLIPAVEMLYSRLTTDPRIAHFFAGVDVERLQAKQVQFLAYVFGGPGAYRGRDIAEAHRELIERRGLNEAHFDIVCDHFKEVLEELGAPAEVVAEAVEILNTSRPVFRAPGAGPAPGAGGAGGAADGGGGAAPGGGGAGAPLPAVTAQLQGMLLAKDAEVDAMRTEVLRLLAGASPERVELVRAALRLRSAGLAVLFDQLNGPLAAGGKSGVAAAR